jgi:hypothetical protein
MKQRQAQISGRRGKVEGADNFARRSDGRRRPILGGLGCSPASTSTWKPSRSIWDCGSSEGCREPRHTTGATATPQGASERNGQQNLVTAGTLCAKEPRPSPPAGLDIIGPKPVCEEYSKHSRLSKEVRTGFVSIALIDISICSMYDLPQSRREKRNRNWYIGDIATVSGPSREYN